MSESKPVKRPRHLMDPNNPVRMQHYADRELTRVQQWVMSVLAATTILHMEAGLVLAAKVVDENRTDARVGLMIIGAIFGLLAIVAARAIHKKSPLSPWVLLGALPAVAAIPWVF